MALSGSVDYSLTRDGMINLAYEDLGAVRTGGTPSADEVTYAAKKINIMVKAWMSHGLQLWVTKEAILIPAKGQEKYSLGPAGDHCSLSMGKTEMRVAGSTSDTTMEVDSTTGMTAADNVGVVTDDGTIHWTTIASVTDSDTFELTTGLDSAAAIDNHIYYYTNKIDRPNEVISVWRRVWDDKNDVEVIRISKDEYYTLSDKNVEGTPVNCYYDPQLTNSVLYNWTTADSIFASNSVFVINVKKPFDDLDSASDDFEFPQEWYEAILEGLKKRIAKHVGLSLQERLLINQDAAMALEEVLGFDNEQASVFIQPC